MVRVYEITTRPGRYFMGSFFHVTPALRNTVKSLRKFYDATESYIRGLESIGQDESSYGSLLTPVILQKIPTDVRTNVTRANGSPYH